MRYTRPGSRSRSAVSSHSSAFAGANWVFSSTPLSLPAIQESDFLPFDNFPADPGPTTAAINAVGVQMPIGKGAGGASVRLLNFSIATAARAATVRPTP